MPIRGPLRGTSCGLSGVRIRILSGKIETIVIICAGKVLGLLLLLLMLLLA